ncbi:unnamed protein product [Ixodes pacificus]
MDLSGLVPSPAYSLLGAFPRVACLRGSWLLLQLGGRRWWGLVLRLGSNVLIPRDCESVFELGKGAGCLWCVGQSGSSLGLAVPQVWRYPRSRSPLGLAVPQAWQFSGPGSSLGLLVL